MGREPGGDEKRWLAARPCKHAAGAAERTKQDERTRSSTRRLTVSCACAEMSSAIFCALATYSLASAVYSSTIDGAAALAASARAADSASTTPTSARAASSHVLWFCCCRCGCCGWGCARSSGSRGGAGELGGRGRSRARAAMGRARGRTRLVVQVERRRGGGRSCSSVPYARDHDVARRARTAVADEDQATRRLPGRSRGAGVAQERRGAVPKGAGAASVGDRHDDDALVREGHCCCLLCARTKGPSVFCGRVCVWSGGMRGEGRRAGGKKRRRSRGGVCRTTGPSRRAAPPSCAPLSRSTLDDASRAARCAQSQHPARRTHRIQLAVCIRQSRQRARAAFSFRSFGGRRAPLSLSRARARWPHCHARPISAWSEPLDHWEALRQAPSSFL